MPLGVSVINNALSASSVKPDQHRVFIDKFFSSLDLIENLKKWGINTTDT